MSKNIKNYDKELNNGFCCLNKNWVLVVEGAWNDIGYSHHVKLFNDESFAKEGLPIAIMLHYIKFEDLDNYDWVKSTLAGYLPMGNDSSHFYVDYIVNSFVVHNNQQLDVSLLEPEFREQVVRNYLEQKLRPEEVFQILADLSKKAFQMKPGKHDKE